MGFRHVKFYQIEPTLHCIDKIQLLINLSTQDRKESEPTFRTFLGSKKYNETEWKIDDIEVIRKQGQRPHGHTLNPQHGTNPVFKIGCLSSWEWQGHIGFVLTVDNEIEISSPCQRQVFVGITAPQNYHGTVFQCQMMHFHKVNWTQ